MGMSHEREQIFACDRCSSTFKRKSDKNRHVRVVHEKSRPFSCPLCPKTFGEKYVIMPPVSVVLNICATISNSLEYVNVFHLHRSNMLKHRASVHDDVRTFRCPYCDESFPQRGLCDAHVRNVHDRKQAKYFCEHCGLPFSRKVQLNEHYEQAHPEYLSTYGQYYSGSSSTAAAAIAGPSVGRDMVRDDRTLVGDTLTGVQTRGLDTGGLPAFGSIGPGEGRTNPPIPPALPYPLPQLAPQRETGEAEEAEVRRRSLQGDNSGL